ncbi:PTS mannose transporter subunit IIAB [Klebsiella pneumoniae]|nr:PTS mannose transporter subunit IIAB [Klebsiella pneumoniae]
MQTAIIIGTHGAAAEQLLRTAEMLIGEQEVTGFIDFFPGENADDLAVKFRAIIERFPNVSSYLFLVDTWGGSPFNAASMIASPCANMDVVTGINVPMLVEVFMARDDGLELAQLVDVALNTGRDGINALKNKAVDAQTTPPSHANPGAKTVAPINTAGNMNITLARIDDRLIHGQVATRWTKESQVSRIIVISDEVAADPVRKTLLTQVAPPGISAHVVEVDKAIRVYNNPAYANERVMLLFTSPKDVFRVVEGGVGIKTVNIGGMAFRQGKKQLTNALSVDEADITFFRKLDALGIDLEVRKVPSDSRIQLMPLLNK